MTRSQFRLRCAFLAFIAASFVVNEAPSRAMPTPSVPATSSTREATFSSHLTMFQSPSRQTSSAAARRSPARDPQEHVGAANEAARIEPVDVGFDNAIQRYAYRKGALFQVYARPGHVTDIALQEGEKLVGPGPVAAGDTARWMIGDTLSGTGAEARVHILVKPIRPDIATNLVINTDRRTYHIELHASPRIYMASVSWTYPADELIALRLADEEARRAVPVADGFALERLNFDYRISGDRPDWRPIRVFDDGERAFIEFAPDITQVEMPPIFVIGEDGQAELVNFRVSGRYLIVDRLFGKAELRLGAGRRQVRVRISNRARTKR